MFFHLEAARMGTNGELWGQDTIYVCTDCHRVFCKGQSVWICWSCGQKRTRRHPW